MSKVRLAIIGNGMVGHRFIEDLLDKSDASLFDITVFCEEPRIAYDRRTPLLLLLSPYCRRALFGTGRFLREARR